MRDILVPVADRPECARALQTAFDLGKKLGASVTGCHIRPHRYSKVTLSPAFADAAWRRKSTKGAPSAARTLFQAIAEKNGFKVTRRSSIAQTAVWLEKVGSPERLMAIFGPVTDLVVVSRPTKPGNVADMFLHAALIESGRPVLVLPQSNLKSIGRHVAIAWNQSADAARAVTAAMPLLQEADDVTIITCGSEDKAGPKSSHLAAYLRNWGVHSKRKTTRGRDVEAELVAAAKEAGADLLIGGAYSRRRWRQKIFGGTTEYLIRTAKLPILLLHC